MNYGEWETINGVKRLKGGLHNMNTVEELLKDGKIDIKYLSGKIERVDGKIENIYTSVSYSEYINLSEDLKQNVKIASKGTNKYSSQKSLFPKIWTDEDIAQAIQKAEELIKTGNNKKLAKVLDENLIRQYGTEGGLKKSEIDNLIKKLNDGKIIEFGEFGKDFTKNIYKVNGIEIKIGSKYVNGKLIEEVTTLVPKY